MKKKWTLAFLIAALAVLFLLPVSVQAATGWVEKNGKKYYYYSDDEYYKKSVVDIDEKMYYFDESGAMVTGWVTYDRDTWTDGFYANSRGELQTGWHKIGDKWYYFDTGSGGMYSAGIRDIDGKWYYFDKKGAMGAGWIGEERGYTDDDGNTETWMEWYYANSKGELQDGWQQINGKWYYFDEGGEDYFSGYMYSEGVREVNGKWYYFYESGAMGTNWIQEVNTADNGETWTTWYYAKSNGELQNGWQQINGEWYYFDKGDENWFGGWMYQDGVREIGSKLYYFDKNGAMQTGWIKETFKYNGGGTGTDWYYADSSGALKTGWMQAGKTWYWFNESGRMASGESERINGKLYVFEKSGALVSTAGWKGIPYDYGTEKGTTWYYTRANGTAETGWKKLGGTWYYFDPDWGYMYNHAAVIDGKLNLFAKSGAWQGAYTTPGWKKDGDSWFYVKSGGKAAAKEWLKLGGKWYYFWESGHMASDGAYEIGGKYYFFEPGGALVSRESWQKTEWILSNGERKTMWYYVGADGVCKTGWQKINGKWYFFDTDYDPYMYADGWHWTGDSFQYEFAANGAWTGRSR